jgi:hypothetical protein
MIFFLLGCTYIPPEFSKCSSEESFCEIKDGLIKFSKDTKYIALIGDTNAGTSILQDFIVPVQELFDISNIVYIFLLYKIANSLRI